MIDASLTTLPDNELIQGYRDGNAACFDVLLARYQAKVYGYIFSVVKDKDVADDIFQDTFFKVVATINGGAYKDENKFIHWVMRIAHNLIVDYFRRNSKMPIVPNRPDYDIVDTLKCDFKDIAARTGVSINTALGRMRYAIINLRRLAEEHNMFIEL